MTELKVGDVVMLNSTGPAMTVIELFNDSQIGCGWFNTKDEFQYKSLPANSLMVLEEDNEIA